MVYVMPLYVYGKKFQVKWIFLGIPQVTLIIYFHIDFLTPSHYDEPQRGFQLILAMPQFWQSLLCPISIILINFVNLKKMIAIANWVDTTTITHYKMVKFSNKNMTYLSTIVNMMLLIEIHTSNKI